MTTLETWLIATGRVAPPRGVVVLRFGRQSEDHAGPHAGDADGAHDDSGEALTTAAIVACRARKIRRRRSRLRRGGRWWCQRCGGGSLLRSRSLRLGWRNEHRLELTRYEHGLRRPHLPIRRGRRHHVGAGVDRGGDAPCRLAEYLTVELDLQARSIALGGNRDHDLRELGRDRIDV